MRKFWISYPKLKIKNMTKYCGFKKKDEIIINHIRIRHIIRSGAKNKPPICVSCVVNNTVK